MHSLLICGFLILHSSFFFFSSKEVDVASPPVAHAAASLPSIVLRIARTSIQFLSINKLMYSPSQNQNEHPSSYTHDDVQNELWQLNQRMRCQSRMKTTRTPSFLHLKNTPLGCFGVPEVRRNTVRVQSSHCMSGIAEPQSLYASAKPGGRPAESMPAIRQRRREDEPAPACGVAPFAGAARDAPRPFHRLV